MEVIIDYLCTIQMDTIVNPLKTVGQAVIHVPENIKSISHDGLSRIRGVYLCYFLFFQWNQSNIDDIVPHIDNFLPVFAQELFISDWIR